jgi:alpha-L-fucosidase 2
MSLMQIDRATNLNSALAGFILFCNSLMSRIARFFVCVLYLSLASQLRADPGPLSISFNYPGDPGLDGPNNSSGVDLSWYSTGLPVGNGKLAAMVFGGVGYELIQFNEDTIWSGQPHDYSNPNTTPARLATIQTECFNGQSILTDAGNWLIATPSRLPEYQCPGALMLTFPHSGTANYLRSLNLSNATVNVHYDYSGVTYNRDIFASAPSNRVIVVHFTTPNNSPTIAFTCTLTNHQSGSYYTIGNDVVMHAYVSSRGDDRYFTTPALGLTNGVQYDARVRMVATGGTVTVGTKSISVTNATEVTLYLSVASNVKAYNDLTADYVTICSNYVANAAAMGYASVRQAQQNDYKNLFDRVVLDLGYNARTSYDLGYRKKLMASDPDDPNLATLFFQLGRYLMISGSRPGSQALNLQGKWNDMTNGYNLWGIKMTLNINEEMNYWGAEVCNLSECTLPLFDLIKDLSVTGHKVAVSNYFCTSTNAWVAHHNTDLWRNAGPVNGWDGYWTSGAAWLCQHLWWHYQYTGDTNWLLTNGYPLMKGAAAFFQDFLVPIPATSIYYSYMTGYSTNIWKVTCPSMSPEHSDPNGHSNYPGPTMDNDIIRELLKNVIAAYQVVGTTNDATFITNLINLRSNIPPDIVGNGGQLREFLGYDDATYDQGHRHCSGLVGFFPGEEISPFYTPALAQAAKVSVDSRGDLLGDVPWGRAWRMNFRTRLQDGDHAFLQVTNVIGGSKTSTNLMFGDGGDGQHRQVDFIFGSLSGIAEMFLQSQSGEVFLLPALPSRWTNGTVSGLCARGGFEVDNMSWTNGKLVSATILSKLGNTCRLRTKCPVDVKCGSTYVNAPMVLPGLYQFTTIAGSNYTVAATNAFETENLSATFSAGDSHQIVTNAAFSNWRGTFLTANATNDYVTYTVSNVAAGTYHVYIGANAGTNCGIFQLAVGLTGGALTNVGTTNDTYSATNVVYLLPIRLTTPTNVINLWTNMLKEFDCGTWQAASNANYDFKLTVVNKNTNSSGFNLAPDYIKLSPAAGGSSSSNSAPTDILLSNTNAAENQPAGTVVGTFSTTDPDAGDTFTYTLVPGTGDTNNSSFTISSNTLKTAAVFDYEVKSSYSIRVRTTDSGSLSNEEAFIINVTNLNEAPTDISLSSSSVAENQPSGTTVGTFSTTDPDIGDTFTYSLVSGAGDTNNASFTISSNALQTAAVFDYETKNSYSIRVRTTDSGGLYFDEVFTVNVTNVNEAPATPTNLVPVNAAVDQPVTPTLQTSAFSDPDAGDTHTASQWLVRRVADSTIVFDSGEDTTDKTSLTVPSGRLDYATTYNWQARYKDNHGAWSSNSTTTTFSTTRPTLGGSGQDGNLLVLSWPTNTTGFFLEHTTNLLTTTWIPASSPAIVNGWYVFTNTMDSEIKFYRLHKP